MNKEFNKLTSHAIKQKERMLQGSYKAKAEYSALCKEQKQIFSEVKQEYKKR